MNTIIFTVVAFGIGFLLSNEINKRKLKKANTIQFNTPLITFKHTGCKGKGTSIIPLGKFYPGWQDPGFECLDCGYVVSACHLTFEAVDPDTVNQIPRDGSVTFFRLN